MPDVALSRLLHPSVVLRTPLGTSTWLLYLRWFAVAGQLLTITGVTAFYPIELPLGPLFGLVGFTAATNLAFTVWLRTHQNENDKSSGEDDALYRTQVASILLPLDLFSLAGMLYYSGGVDNPFVFFFFVNLAVAGVVLRPAWAWSLTLLSVGSFALLVHFRTTVPELSISSEASHIRNQGMLVAFSTCAAVITYFVSRISEELTRRQDQLREAQQAHARSLRLEALTTLAAGAAHELASPLSTIAVIVSELERHVESTDTSDTVRTDLVLIESELKHCKKILSRMRSAAGDHVAEKWDRVSLVDLVDVILDGIREPHRVFVPDQVDEFDQYSIWLPLEAMAQAIRNLVGNALDASPEEKDVELNVSARENQFEITVKDYGDGMPEHILRHAVEPFFTTKEPGNGMGLGLFLARNVITRLGGTLEFESIPGSGTTATVKMPRHPSSEENGMHGLASQSSAEPLN